jgi:hypothetical protein
MPRALNILLKRLLRLRRADPSFSERAWQAEAAGLPVEEPGQVSLDGASARRRGAALRAAAAHPCRGGH